jgi:tetratricopeptide (TPR) repeat protein
MIRSGIHELGSGVAGMLSNARAQLAAGRAAEAEAGYRRVLAFAPQQTEALHGLGILALRSGRLPEAAELIKRVIGQQPRNAVARNDRGLVLARLGRHAEAVASFDRALALQPDFPDALSNRGSAMHALGRPEEALASLDKALALAPDHAEAWSNRGLLLAELGRTAEALTCHDRALALRPDDPRLYVSRGNALCHLGRIQESLSSYDEAILLHPGLSEAHCRRAVALRRLGRLEDALASLNRALALPPARPEVQVALGGVLNDLNRADEALSALDRAIALRPRLAAAHCERGIALTLLDRAEEGLASFARATALAPAMAEAWSQQAVAQAQLRRPDKALAALDRALAIQPNDAAAYHIKSLLLLQAGEYEGGWPLYEARRVVPGAGGTRRGFRQPQWRGEPLAGRTLLLHAEPGIADTIQFCRYAALAAARAAAEGGRVIVEVPKALRVLLASLPGAPPLIVHGEKLPPFDLHCPLPSLPLVFGTTLASVPAAAGYLAADPTRVPRWTPLLADLPGPRVGLVPSGNAGLRGDNRRAIPFATLLPLTQAGPTLLALQTRVREGDRFALAAAPAIRTLGPLFSDFADAAAVIAQLDLVIAADTALAHLAGAMGKPVWVLLPFAADWRWLHDRSDSPWYASARLFRQPRPGDWDSVVAEVLAALAALPHGAAG